MVALRGKLGLAAKLTVDEMRRTFKPWLAFSRPPAEALVYAKAA